VQLVEGADGAIFIDQSNCGVDCIGIRCATAEPNSQPRFSTGIAVKLCGCGILPNNEIQFSVMIEIAKRRATAFPLDTNAAPF
jgi:hypothetical protein